MVIHSTQHTNKNSPTCHTALLAYEGNLPFFGRDRITASKHRQDLRAQAASRTATETPEQRQKRLQDLCARAAKRRASETPEQNEVRIGSVHTRADAKRAAQTDEERETEIRERHLRTSIASARHGTPASDIPFEVLKISGAAFKYQSSPDYSIAAQIGSMSQSCGKCGALKWQKETKGMCCSNAKVSLPTLTSPAELLKTLLHGKTAESRHFLDNMHKYNSCFQMKSFGTDKELTEHGYMQLFKVQGQVYHTIGSLLPMAGEDTKILQI